LFGSRKKFSYFYSTTTKPSDQVKMVEWEVKEEEEVEEVYVD
jgi:hypothetical protein